MSPYQLAAIKDNWLRQCAAHDAGMAMSCTCPAGDPRSAIDALVAEVERLREERDSALSRAEMSGEQTVAYEAEVERLKSGQPWEELFRQRDEAIAERDRLREQITEADAVIVRAQDALGVDHPVWVILDDYDGSMDSVHALVRERDDARTERDRYAEVVEAAQQWRDAIKPCVCGNGDPHQYLVSEGESALIAAVDRLTPGDGDG